MSIKVINGLSFQTSSYSEEHLRCVGVTKKKGRVLIINTKTKKSPISFSVEEWQAFLQGVKNGEFDHYCEK